MNVTSWNLRDHALASGASSPSVRIEISADLLLRLLQDSDLCLADISALDQSSHEMLRQMALKSCMYQLQGLDRSCDGCALQNNCQKHCQLNDIESICSEPSLRLTMAKSSCFLY